jgi:hypothetical protein
VEYMLGSARGSKRVLITLRKQKIQYL